MKQPEEWSWNQMEFSLVKAWDCFFSEIMLTNSTDWKRNPWESWWRCNSWTVFEMPVCQTRWSCRKVYICTEIVEVLYHNKQPREKEMFLRKLSRPGALPHSTWNGCSWQVMLPFCHAVSMLWSLKDLLGKTARAEDANQINAWYWRE